MASWMIHLRVAQGIQERLHLHDEAAFIMGNLAPDSGVPSPDGHGYIPDAATSHFRTLDANGLKDVHAAQFINQYFSPVRRTGYPMSDYIFLYGYLTHLLTDQLWEPIAYDACQRYPDLYRENSAAFWHFIKKDWYDLDFLYLRDHPDFRAWQIYTGISAFKNDRLEFFPSDAYMQRREFIMDFYSNGVASVMERDTYISASEVDAFIVAATEDILRITADIAEELTQKGFASPI